MDVWEANGGWKIDGCCWCRSGTELNITLVPACPETAVFLCGLCVTCNVLKLTTLLESVGISARRCWTMRHCGSPVDRLGTTSLGYAGDLLSPL